MLNLLLVAVRAFIRVVRGHEQVAFENVALRHQLAVLMHDNRDRLCAIGIDYFGFALKRL
jgi:hypothetical protein